jgi:hypothetical protein
MDSLITVANANDVPSVFEACQRKKDSAGSVLAVMRPALRHMDRSVCHIPYCAGQYAQLGSKLAAEVMQILKPKRRGDLPYGTVSHHQLLLGAFNLACEDVFVWRQAGGPLEGVRTRSVRNHALRWTDREHWSESVPRTPFDSRNPDFDLLLGL